MASPPLEIICIDGLVPYGSMLEAQHRVRAEVEGGGRPNTLFLLQHAPVITCGRNTRAENLLASSERLSKEGVALFKTDRGGDVTYHGPGQLVAYPILRLKEFKASVGWYLRTLEQVLIGVLGDYGIEGEQIEGLTGVWSGGAKVAAIGVGVHQWVTFHGIALNVSVNLAHFGLIVPCGIGDKPVTSLEVLLGEVPDIEEVQSRFCSQFLAVFGIDPVTTRRCTSVAEIGGSIGKNLATENEEERGKEKYVSGIKFRPRCGPKGV